MTLAPPRFSIVVPSYQQGAYLAATLRSLEDQTGIDLEILIKDGGSTDGSVEKIKAFAASSRWKVEWQSGPDGGQSAAVNSGLRQARGDFVGFLNSDDVLTAGALADAAAILRSNPIIDAVYGAAELIDASGQVNGRYPVEPWDWERLGQTCIIAQPACFWRRSLHERAGWFDEHLWGAFDYDFWLRAAAKGRFEHVPRVWAQARVHAEAKSTASAGRLWEETIRIQARHRQGRIGLDMARRVAGYRAWTKQAKRSQNWHGRLLFALGYWWHFTLLGKATGSIHTLLYWRKWVYPPWNRWMAKS